MKFINNLFGNVKLTSCKLRITKITTNVPCTIKPLKTMFATFSENCCFCLALFSPWNVAYMYLGYLCLQVNVIFIIQNKQFENSLININFWSIMLKTSTIITSCGRPWVFASAEENGGHVRKPGFYDCTPLMSFLKLTDKLWLVIGKTPHPAVRNVFARSKPILSISSLFFHTNPRFHYQTRFYEDFDSEIPGK